MKNDSISKIYLPNDSQNTLAPTVQPHSSTVVGNNSYYKNISTGVNINHSQMDSTIERVAQWFLNISAMSNKKLQKLCYYAYCWFIVFFNDAEEITSTNSNIQVLCSERFQAWIHGPVSPRLYQRYKSYAWHDIPKVTSKPMVEPELESLLQQVWNAYGSFSADELEAISHQESPWKMHEKTSLTAMHVQMKFLIMTYWNIILI